MTTLSGSFDLSAYAAGHDYSDIFVTVSSTGGYWDLTASAVYNTQTSDLTASVYSNVTFITTILPVSTLMHYDISATAGIVCCEGGSSYSDLSASFDFMSTSDITMSLTNIKIPSTYVSVGNSGMQVLNTGAVCNTSGFSYDITGKDIYAYVADGPGGIKIIDVSDLTNPVQISSCAFAGTALGIDVKDNYVYVANGAEGLRIIDVSDPLSPTVTGTYNTVGTAEGVHIKGNYAYVADGANGLVIIDISNKGAPTLAGTCSVGGGGYAYNVYAYGNYAHVAAGANGLKLIDISNPASPTVSGSFTTSGTAYGVYLDGSGPNLYTFVAAGSAGLKVVNTTVATAPVLASYYSLPGTAVDVGIKCTTKGNFAFVSMREGTVEIIDITHRDALVYMGSHIACDYVYGLYVFGNYTSDLTARANTATKVIDALDIIITPQFVTYRTGAYMLNGLNLRVVPERYSDLTASATPALPYFDMTADVTIRRPSIYRRNVVNLTAGTEIITEVEYVNIRNPKIHKTIRFAFTGGDKEFYYNSLTSAIKRISEKRWKVRAMAYETTDKFTNIKKVSYKYLDGITPYATIDDAMKALIVDAAGDFWVDITGDATATGGVYSIRATVTVIAIDGALDLTADATAVP